MHSGLCWSQCVFGLGLISRVLITRTRHSREAELYPSYALLTPKQTLTRTHTRARAHLWLKRVLSRTVWMCPARDSTLVIIDAHFTLMPFFKPIKGFLV